MGCERLQLFRNNFNIEDFSYGEILELCVLLTKTLRMQINRDHKIFWSWCAQVALNASIPDNDWSNAFCNLVNLILIKRKSPDIRGPKENFYEIVHQLINSHVLQIIDNKYEIAAPLSFSVLEGLLRRKKDVSRYVAKDGKVIQQFTLGSKSYNNGDRINQMKILFSLRDQYGNPSSSFFSLKKEIEDIFNNEIRNKGFGNMYDLVNDWRNEHQHGELYWMNKVPVILNIICLLLFEEIESDNYNGIKDDIKTRIQFLNDRYASNILHILERPHWEIYPPDI
ncbi:MAG: hypothetical protein KatS3mg003_2289 [Candidatus Nitrosocaldaceae archaeon]|nr:MAG: hypothetical protein KatS3mg003_2289 [Candidatus Nitrosocaldaceae archaeon]